MPLIKEIALSNLLHSSIGDVLFITAVLIVALSALLLITRLLLRRSFPVAPPTLASFFIMAYVVLMSLPAIVWFYVAPEDPIRYTFFLAVQSVLVTFPIGVLLANALFIDLSLPGRVVDRFFRAPLQKAPDDRYTFRVWVVMLGTSVLVALVYIGTSSYVPLIGALRAYGEVAGTIVRRSVVADGDAIHYAHALAARLFLPFCLVYAYFMSYVYAGRWRYLYALTFAVAAFVSSLTFDRMFPLSVVLFLMLAVYFKYQDRQARARALPAVTDGRRAPRRRPMSKLRLAGYIAGLVLLAGLVGGVLSRAQYNRPLDLEVIRITASQFLVDRVLLDPSFMAYIYFEEFNDPAKFMWGTSMHPLISAFFGIEFLPTISPSFLAELWLNFGWLGVLVGPVLIGLVLQCIQVTLFSRKTVSTLAFYLILLLNGAWSIYGHVLATMVISVFLPSVLILVLLKKRRMDPRFGLDYLAPSIRYANVPARR